MPSGHFDALVSQRNFLIAVSTAVLDGRDLGDQDVDASFRFW
jgi:hypothetical protein